MDGRARIPDLEGLEKRVDELERLADSLGGVPDEKLVAALNEATRLLREINSGLEAGIDAAGERSQRIGGLLEELDFGAFDEALGELERQERSADELDAP